MSQLEKSDKRIVSKAEYVALKTKKGSLNIIGSVMLSLSGFLGILGLLPFIYFLGMFLMGFAFDPENAFQGVFLRRQQ